MKKEFKNLLGSISMAAILVSATNAQNLPANIEKLTSVEGITEYRLKSNGLKVLLFPDGSKQTTTVNITYMVGSRHEGYGETGMAHLLEHMVFKGTPKHKDIPAEFTERGARFNGTTWVDRTNYYETFSASDDNLDWALDLESDRMVNSFIAKKDLDSEFSVVRNEFELGENDPTSILMERVMSTSFLWHNYGKSTIGNRADIENVPIENLQGFYRRFYQPDNAILLIAGKLDEAKTLQMIDKHFSKIEKPTRTLPQTWTSEPMQDGERMVTLRRTGEIQVAAAGYHIPAGSHHDYVAVSVLLDVLTDNPSGRLYQKLVSDNKATNVWGYAMQTKEPGFAYINVDVRQEQNLEAARQILCNTLDSLKYKPVTEEEVNRIRTRNLKQIESLYRNTEQTGYLLSEFMALGDWRMFFITRDHLERLTVRDVNEAAVRYFKPSNRTVGLFIPDKSPDRSPIPLTPNVSEIVEGYKGKATMSEGEVFDPSIDNVAARAVYGKAGTATTVFLAKKTRGSTVKASIQLKIGDPKSLVGKQTVSALTSQMLMKGTKKYTEQQLKDELDALKATVNISGSGSDVNVNIETVRENFPKVLALVTEMLRESAIQQKEFEEVLRQNLAATEKQISEPNDLAQNTLDRIMNPYPKTDARYVMTIQEQIDALKALKLDDVKRFYADFYGGSSAGIGIVGDFDVAEATKIISTGIGAWKSPIKYQRIPNTFVDVKAKNEAIETPDKANALFLAGLNLPISDSDPDFASLYVGNFVLGGGALSSRLADRIRQKEGISYGVGSYMSAEAQDKTGNWGAYAIAAPENVERLEKAFQEEIEKILKEGITEKELEDVKKSIIQSRNVNRADDNRLVGKLGYYAVINRKFDWDKNFETQINKLTVDDVNKVLRKHIVPSKITIVKAGDLEKAKKSKP